MRRKWLASLYITAFELALSWQQWDGVIETIMIALTFWGLNLILMIMVEMEEMEEKDDADHKSNQKRKASGKRKHRAA